MGVEVKPHELPNSSPERRSVINLRLLSHYLWEGEQSTHRTGYLVGPRASGEQKNSSFYPEPHPGYGSQKQFN